MAYQKQTWVTGETITEQKLNHMEDGIANTILIVGITEDGTKEILDKTWQQIYDASYAVVVKHLENEKDYKLIPDVFVDTEMGYVVTVGEDPYVTDSPDGYPVNDK